MRNQQLINLIIRYLILLIIPISNLFILYYILTPLTFYPVFWILSLFYDQTGTCVSNSIYFGNSLIELISSCIAGSAYYLLLILNLTTPMKAKKLIKSLIFTLGVFWICNIIRIIVFAYLLDSNFSYFDLTHKLVWYFGSIVLVFLIWIINVKLFKIKEVPIYSDIKEIIRDIKNKPQKNKK